MNRKGFTIIEMVMVIIIVAILAVVSIPRFESFYYIKLDGAAKRVLTDIRFTQQLSIARHENYKIVFTTGTDIYQVQRVSDNVYATDPFTRANLIVNFTTDPQHKGIDISATNLTAGTLQFDWQGIPYNSTGVALTADASVTLTYKDNTKTIYVTPATGRVRVQ
jgi:prepilin-type N-terminal cleavage/methylation domain-containing protein